MAKKAGTLKHLLPPLPYEPAALEPHVDAHTMMLHHDKHHASYVASLNFALEEFPELQERTAVWLLVFTTLAAKPVRERKRRGALYRLAVLWLAVGRLGPAARCASGRDRQVICDRVESLKPVGELLGR